MPARFSWPLLAAALFFLNASLTFANVWPTPAIRWQSALSVELAALVACVALLPTRAPRLARRGLPSLWLLLVMGRYLDVTAPGLYGRDFNLYWDAAHLGNVAAMLARAVPAWQLAAGTLMAALLLTAIWWSARMAWVQVARAIAVPGPRRGLLALAVTLLVGYVAVLANDTARHPFVSPVTAAYARQARYVGAMVGASPAARRLGAGPNLDRPPAMLGGADVVLAFVEAYGAITYDHPTMSAALAPRRTELAAAAADAGRVVLSAFVESPTFGASSWLAHLTLLSGVEVRDQYDYVALMADGRDSLPRALARHGYRSLALMPGIRQAWPEGDFYGFARIYGRDALDYQGPRFGWWGIPDQYSLARIDAVERPRTPRPPVFITFPTSTTHAPFGPVPPYQPEWSRVLSASPFPAAEVDAAMAANPDLANLGPSYTAATAYALRTFAGYVRANAGAPLVLILIGDHQPVAAVTGPGASYDVPVHVVISPGVLADRLRAAGFADGMTPPRRPLGPMHALTALLVESWSAPAPIAASPARPQNGGA